MIEAATDTRTRSAYSDAHEARAEALKDIWFWLTRSSLKG